MTDRRLYSTGLREVLDAEVKLAHLAIADDFVVLWESESCPQMKKHFSNQYQKFIGVHPARREELTVALDLIRQGGEGTVAEVIATLNRTPPDRPLSPAAEPRSPGSAREGAD